MIKNLVIVESPAKAKTIEKFLGKDFIVRSCFGHIRDLAEGDLSVDIEHDFKPHYVVPDDKKKVVGELVCNSSVPPAWTTVPAPAAGPRPWAFWMFRMPLTTVVEPR